MATNHDNYILIKQSLAIGATGIAMYQLLDEVLFDNEWQDMIDQQIADLQSAIGDPTVINGLQGEVEIVAGSNITVDVNGQQITISATGGGSFNPDSIEVTLRPDLDNTIDLGTAGNSWNTGWINRIYAPLAALSLQSNNNVIEISDSSAGKLRFPDGLGGWVDIRAQDDIGGQITLRWPNTVGDAGQVLSTDGAGIMSWVDQSGGGGSPGGASTQIQFNDGGDFGATSNLTWNGLTMLINRPTVPLGLGDPADYALDVRVGGSAAITLGGDADRQVIQAWENKPLHINPYGNSVMVGANPGTDTGDAFQVQGAIRASAGFIGGGIFAPFQYAINLESNQGVFDSNGVKIIGFDELFLRDRDNKVALDWNNGLLSNWDHEADNTEDNFSLQRLQLRVKPLQDSDDEQAIGLDSYLTVGENNSGFSYGVNRNALTALRNFISATSTSDTGYLVGLDTNFDIGNGSDPVTVRGLSYAFGFGTIRAGATVTNGIQGYGFQPNAEVGANVGGVDNYINAFYDNANLQGDAPGYNSFTAAPGIERMTNNKNYNAFQASGRQRHFIGNAGYTGLGIFPQIDDFEDGSFQGIAVSPQIGDTNSATGININMNDVTVRPGVQAEVIIQDVLVRANQPSSDANNATFEFVDDGTAGSETVSISGLNFTVHMESGSSTAQNIVDAINNSQASIYVTAEVDGVASNPQVAVGPQNLAGGVNSGTKRAIEAQGDVNINGSLSFTGALSIGALNAFATYPIVDGTGAPTSSHTIITQPVIGANLTRNNVDYLGSNTAMLLTVGDNTTINTGFIGLAALGLPAVLSLGVGASVELVTGAVFALSLDATAGGGAIEELYLTRALTIPNGVTSVDKLKAFGFDLPFGDPGTQTWGVHISPATAMNYMAGSLVIGDSELPSNPSVGLELNSTTKAIVSSRMTTAQRDALNAINGMVVYNTDTDKLQVYAAAVWQDLH